MLCVVGDNFDDKDHLIKFYYLFFYFILFQFYFKINKSKKEENTLMFLHDIH